jgi:cytochrome c-type biogenesis protein CcmH/NrfG
MLRKWMLLLVFSWLAAVAAATEESSLEELLQAGHWKRLRQVTEPRAANPKDASAAYFLSCARIAFGDVDGALEPAQRAVALEPGNSQYHLQLGVVLGRKANKASFLKAMSLGGQYKAEIRKAVELDGKNIEAIWELMEFYWHAPGIAGGDQKQARALAGDIMRLNPAKGYLALTELADKDTDVEDYYRKAAQADPKSYEVQIRLARFYASDKHWNAELAEKHAKQAIALDPGRIGGYIVLAAVRAHQERWQELDLLLREAESRVPGDLTAYFQAGIEILLAGKDLARSEQYFRKYLGQEPEGYAPRLSRAHWRIGQVLAKQGRKAEAITEMQAALQLEPSMEDARKDLKALK